MIYTVLKNRLIISLIFVIFLYIPVNISAQQNNLDKVTLSLKWLTQCQFAGYYAALENGYYREEGIDLTIEPGGPDINSINLVESGTSDFGIKWLGDFFEARDKGFKLISIAQILQSNGLIMISKTRSGIKKPEDFIGKKIGIWFFGNEIQFYTMMNKLKIPLNSMEILPLKWSIKPFLDDKYDAVMAMTFNEYLRVLDSGYKKNEINIIDFKDYGFNFPGQVIFTKQATFDENPDLCRRMVKASLKGWRWAMQNKEKAVDIVLKDDQTGILKKNRQITQMNEITKLINYNDIPLGYHSPKHTTFVIKSLFKNGIISNPDDLEKSYTNSFIE